MSDDHVLKMPIRRFWSMEQNRPRITAEQDIRRVQVHSSTNSEENYTKVIDRLSAELGETSKVVHPKIVKPEPGASQKFKHLTGS